MGKKIFVGGLNWRTTEPDLKAAFARYSEVASVRIIIDRETGRSKCFGFVEFVNQEDVPKVIETCDGMKLDGRNIKVSLAKERPAPAEAKKQQDDSEPHDAPLSGAMDKQVADTSGSVDGRLPVEKPENDEAGSQA